MMRRMERIDLATTDDERLACFDVLHELRPALTREAFLPALARMASEGFCLAALWHEGEVRAVAGFRSMELFAAGRILYVDDLVTAARHRGKGYGARLLGFLKTLARERGLSYLELDSGSRRLDAHRFYRRHGLDEVALHFSAPITAAKWTEPDLAP